MKNRTGVVALLLFIVAYALFFRRKDKYITQEIACLTKYSPYWCPDEFSTAYSADASSSNDFSFYNEQTGLCRDGTRDCVYTERYNNERILEGIFNSKNVELSQKFLDDVYAERLTFSPEIITTVKEGVKFENGLMKLKTSTNKFATVKVGLSQDLNALRMTEEINAEGFIFIPSTLFVVYIALYFKLNNLPKPTLKYELKSTLNMRQLRQMAPEPVSIKA